MRVALISEHASPLATIGGVDAGGQNVYVAEMARALGQRGHDVTVYTRRENREAARSVIAYPRVEVVHVDAGPPIVLPKDELLPHMAAFAAELTRLWRAAPPDVAHSHFWMSAVATRPAARACNIPWLHTYHALGAEKRRMQGDADTSPTARICIEREILREADAIVATSSAEIFEHRRTGGGRELKLIPCGVSSDLLSDRARAFDVPRTHPYRIATLSRLVERKGVATVIEALSAVPNAELVVAGGGETSSIVRDPEVLRLASIARACGVDDRVRFVGPLARAAIGGFIRSADVVVCVPLYEPFGLVPLEAMACSRPVVCSQVGGLVDTVVDGITGLHVPSANPAELARALRLLLADEELRTRCGAAGRRRVERQYTWAKVAERMESFYARMMTSAPVARETTA